MTVEEKYAPVLVQYDGAVAGTAPVDARMDGYIFAGWFTDSSCKETSALQGTTATDDVFAKYVDRDILSLGFQVSANVLDDIDTNDNSADLRLVTTVDSQDYETVGFKIQIEGYQPQQYSSTTVYENLYAIGADPNSPGESYNPTVYSEASTLFSTRTVPGISADEFGVYRFIIQPFWTTYDGTTVYGEQRTTTMAEAIEASKAALSSNEQ